MKRLIVALMLVSSSAWACEKGCSEYKITPNQTVCACDEATQTGDPIKPSSEKPPKSATPAYQREGLQVDMPKPQTTEEEDAARLQHSFQGKK